METIGPIVCTAVRYNLPALFQYLGNQGDVFSRAHAQGLLYTKETLEVRLELVSCPRRQIQRHNLQSYVDYV